MLKAECEENIFQLLSGISQVSLYSERIITRKEKNERNNVYCHNCMEV